MNAPFPLRVSVLIDHRPNHPGEVGGLAGTWEQVSRAAQGRDDLELSLFFLGDQTRSEQLAPNIRRVLLSPALGTERLGFLKGIPTHTDLAPIHLRLLGQIKGSHVIHTTDAFYAFAKTGLWARRLWGIPLVNSIQTDILSWARIYTPRILSRMLPSSVMRWLLERYRYLDRQERSMERRLGRYVGSCSAALISHPRDFQRLSKLAPSTPVYYLRRGIDLDRFHPKRRDREQILRRFGIPRDTFLFLFVGRMDPVKGVMVAARVVRELLQLGLDVHLLAVGDGSQREEASRLLAHGGTFPGNLPHQELGWIYASADLLLFPSEAEVWPNVVTEAKACGLPVLACQEGARHVMLGQGQDGILLPDRDPERWVRLSKALLENPGVLREMGLRARQDAQNRYPSWTEVLEQDILPVWRGAASGSMPLSGGANTQSLNFPSEADGLGSQERDSRSVASEVAASTRGFPDSSIWFSCSLDIIQAGSSGA